MNKEQFNELMNTIKKTLGDESSALISNELAQVMTIYPASLDEIEKLKAENEKIKTEKEDLIKVNGQLLQKIGFDEKPNESEIDTLDKSENTITYDDVIDEKGELID